MGRLARTDDDALRVEFISSDLGFRARWPMIIAAGAVIIVAAPAVSWIIWASLAWLALGPIWIIWSAIVGTAPTVYLTVKYAKKAGKRVKPVTPAAYHANVFLNEARAPRPKPNPEHALQPQTPITLNAHTCAFGKAHK